MRPAFAGEVFKVWQIRVCHVSSHLQNPQKPCKHWDVTLVTVVTAKIPVAEKASRQDPVMVLRSRGPVVP